MKKVIVTGGLGFIGSNLIDLLIKKNFFSLKKIITKKNIYKYISHIAPCIEVVGYRQRKKGIKYLGDLSSDFGANVKFVIGPKKKFKKIIYPYNKN